MGHIEELFSFDENYKCIKELVEFKYNEEVLTLAEGAEGLYFRESNQLLYIADTENNRILVSDLEGNVKPVLTTTYVSHYIWVNDRELVAHCSTEPGRKSMYCIDMETATWVEYDMPYFHDGGHPDIHCNISPDGSYIIGDGYVREGYREIQYYKIATGQTRMILKAASIKPDPNDIRCDLHNRFVFDGKFISFDTIHNGKRQVAMVSAEPVDAL